MQGLSCMQQHRSQQDQEVVLIKKKHKARDQCSRHNHVRILVTSREHGFQLSKMRVPAPFWAWLALANPGSSRTGRGAEEHGIQVLVHDCDWKAKAQADWHAYLRPLPANAILQWHRHSAGRQAGMHRIKEQWTVTAGGLASGLHTKLPIWQVVGGANNKTPTWPSFSWQGKEAGHTKRGALLHPCPGSTHTGHHQRVRAHQMLTPQQPPRSPPTHDPSQRCIESLEVSKIIHFQKTKKERNKTEPSLVGHPQTLYITAISLVVYKGFPIDNKLNKRLRSRQ